eukprot:10581236-Alexandrium_andersonii.AAC.1
MSASLVGSEMCIRDRACLRARRLARPRAQPGPERARTRAPGGGGRQSSCLLYTSDAADDM